MPDPTPPPTHPPTAPQAPGDRVTAGFTCVMHASGKCEVIFLQGTSAQDLLALMSLSQIKISDAVREFEAKEIARAKELQTPWGKAKARLAAASESRKAAKEARRLAKLARAADRAVANGNVIPIDPGHDGHPPEAPPAPPAEAS